MTLAQVPHSKVKLRVEDFDLLALSGGLEGLERTELFDGDIYLMNPQYSRHATAKAHIQESLIDWKRANRPDLLVLTEVSVAMPPHDEPMPDITLCFPSKGELGIAVDTVLLLVEIANSSAEHDLGYKAALYGRQGVPEYWVVDLKDKRVVRHSGPGAEGYAVIEPVAFGEVLEAETLTGLMVETVALLV